MKFCPNCGTQLADDAAFCTGCGTNLGPQMNTQQQTYADNQYGYQAPDYNQAPNYGYQAPDYNQAPNQGYQAPNYNQAPNYGYQQTPPQPAKKKSKAWIKKLISLALVVAILVAAWVIFLPNAEMVAKRAVKAIFDGDADKAAKYFLNESVAKETLEWYVEYTEGCSNVKLKVGEVEDADKEELEWISAGVQLMGGSEVKSAKSVEIIVTYTYDGEVETESVYVVLVKQGIQWKIVSFD